MFSGPFTGVRHPLDVLEQKFEYGGVTAAPTIADLRQRVNRMQGAAVTENGWTRYGFKDAWGAVDIREALEPRGAWGVGSVHHLAWRVDDDAHQLAVRKQIEAAGTGATPVIDRFWFRSVYFREPGGVLFEIATDGPGFATDEDPSHLGESLVLPPWLEATRARIEGVLPALRMPE